MNWELPDALAGFRKGRGTRYQIGNIHWIIEKAREFQKTTSFIDYAKVFDCVDHNKLWKILQEMGILDHLTCLLRNLFAGQEATVRTKHGQPCLFNLYAEYIMWNARLDKAQGGIKIAGRNINNLIKHRWYHSYGRKWRGTKDALYESERGHWINWLKIQHSKD